jgi:predicted nucleotidyltransferase
LPVRYLVGTLLRVDLSLPLRSVVPTLDAEALSVLAGTETPLTGTAVARLAARGSRPGIQRVLNRLVAHGLVVAQPAGPATLYRLNRRHLLAPAILSLVAARGQLVDRLRTAVADWPTPAEHVSLFGSFARHDAGLSSDIDVLVVRPATLSVDDPAWQQQLRELEETVARWTGNQLALFETTQEDLRRGVAADEPVIVSWRDDAVHLAGAELRDMLVRVTA